VTNAAQQLLTEHGCTAAMRATYVDASGSLVATVAVAVLPTVAAQSLVVRDLTPRPQAAISPSLVRALTVPDSPAAAFGDPQRQITAATGVGPYVILSTAGFADGRHHVRLFGDQYLDSEITSFTTGLIDAAERWLRKQPPPVVCPAAPGC
jgi:hypothetical protein